MRVLVTGGAGFIGSNLTEFLLNEGHLVHCIDNFNDYYNPKIKEENLKNIRSNPNYRLFKADILDYDNLSQIFENNQYDIVVHLAARAGVRPSIKQPFRLGHGWHGFTHITDRACVWFQKSARSVAGRIVDVHILPVDPGFGSFRLWLRCFG